MSEENRRRQFHLSNKHGFVRKVKLTPSVFLAHAKTLERGTAKYPIRRVVCKSFTIPQNYLDVSHEKLFSGLLPTRVVVGLVRNDAFNGHVERNPFNFPTFKFERDFAVSGRTSAACNAILAV